MLAENFNAVLQILRRAEQCQLPIKIVCIKLDSYDLAAGSVCLHILGRVWYLIVSIPDLCNLITFMLLRNRSEDWSKSFEACMFLITAVRHIFKQTKKHMDCASVEYFIL